MKQLLEHLKTYLQLHHDQNDGGVHINLIARINDELEKPEPQIVGYIHPTVVQSLTESNTYNYIFSKEFEVAEVKSIPLIVKQ